MYLNSIQETRPLHHIPPKELNEHLCQFFATVRQKNGSEYEPCSLRSFMSSFERLLKKHSYGFSLVSSFEFGRMRELLKCKQKDLKKQGKGNKPRTADQLSDSELTALYEKKELGDHTPGAMLNTLWLNNTTQFGMRGGASEHRALCWGDVTLCLDAEVNQEYLEYNERQTKTRTGENLNNVRLTKPKMYATGNNNCPVQLYKKFANKRPDSMNTPDSPFYLAPVTHNPHPRFDEQWFLTAPVGRNKLANLLKVMVERADLPSREYKRLTNSSVRKRLCQTLMNNGVEDTMAIHITGHKNPQSLNSYR